MPKTGLKHLTNPGNHGNQEFPVFVKLFFSLTSAFSIGGVVPTFWKSPFLILSSKMTRQTPNKLDPIFPRFTNRSPGFTGILGGF